MDYINRAAEKLAKEAVETYKLKNKAGNELLSEPLGKPDALSGF